MTSDWIWSPASSSSLGPRARSRRRATDRAPSPHSSRVAWLDLWERAVAAAAERLAELVNARLAEAAVESRLPAGDSSGP